MALWNSTAERREEDVLALHAVLVLAGDPSLRSMNERWPFLKTWALELNKVGDGILGRGPVASVLVLSALESFGKLVRCVFILMMNEPDNSWCLLDDAYTYNDQERDHDK
jgi:hypothetical protein